MLLKEDGIYLMTYMLKSDPENEPFYKHLGFVPAESALVFKRRK